MIDVRFITFISLCETRNYTKTSELLYVTQPTVTHHIKSIEKSYNIKLFTSNNKNFQLTPQGELLYKYVLQLQAFDSQFERMLSASEKGKEQVSFAVTPAVNNGYLKFLLSKWSENNNDLIYHINIDNYKSIIDKLRVGLIDFALVDNNFAKKQYGSISLLNTKLVLGVNKKHPLAKKKIVSFDDLVNHKIILDVAGNHKREFLESELKHNNRNVKELSNFSEINCPNTTIDMVLNSDYAAFFYSSEIDGEVKAKKLVAIPVLEVNNSIEFSLIYNRNHLSVKLIEEIGNEFIQIHKELNNL